MPSLLVRWHSVKFQLTDPNVCGECLRMWWKCNYAVLGCLACSHQQRRLRQQQQRQQCLLESLRSCKNSVVNPPRSIPQAIKRRRMTLRLSSPAHTFSLRHHSCREVVITVLNGRPSHSARWEGSFSEMTKRQLTTYCQTLKIQWFTCVSECRQLNSIALLWPTFATFKLDFMTYI